MEDFVITRVKNWKDMENFIFCLFFSLHMYNSNTNSLLIIDAHLTKKTKQNKTKGIMYNLFP